MGPPNAHQQVVCPHSERPLASVRCRADTCFQSGVRFRLRNVQKKPSQGERKTGGGGREGAQG